MAAIPAQLGRYRIIRLLATGGMGEVFLARQEGPAGFSRPAVVKRVLAHLAREPDFVQMFLDEARLAGNLAHPNIVQIFELGEADGTWFIAMEYLHGRSLRLVRQQVSRKGQQMSPVQASRMVSQALDGLQYAHTLVSSDGTRLQVVHRDISPDNIFVGFNGVVKVLDFGIAKAANATTTTRAGMVKGKCAYMSPEQLLAQALDGRTDVYAAGVVLYELLAGEMPFAGPSDAAVINAVMTAPVPPLEDKAPHVPHALCLVVMKALAKTPENRWQTAAEFSSALERFVASSGEPNTNALTAAYMRSLFGDVAPEDSEPPSATRNAVGVQPLLLRDLAQDDEPLGLQLPASLGLQQPGEAGLQRLEPLGLRPEPVGLQRSEGVGRPDALAASPQLFDQESQLPQELELPKSAQWHMPPSDKLEIESLAASTGSHALELDRPGSYAGSALHERMLPAPLELATRAPPVEPADALAQPEPPESFEPEPPLPSRPATRSRWPMIAVPLVLCAAVAVGYFVLPNKYTGRDLKMTVADVFVSSEPRGATLRIGDNQVGITPWAGSNVWAGEVTWELTAAGYQKMHGTFKGGEPVKLNLKLKKKER